MSSNINYFVEIKDVANNSNSKIFNLDTSQPDKASSILNLILSDSIYEMYPYGSFTLEDTSGRFYSDIIFAEGHKYRITLSNKVDTSLTGNEVKDKIFLTGEYYWNHNHIILPEKSNTVAGTNTHSFTHSLHLEDGYFIDDLLGKSKRNFKDMTASDVVKKLLFPNMIKYEKYIVLSKTTGKRDWYLGKHSAMEFIYKVLSTYAKKSGDNSPFVSFINLKNEFHFRSMADLIANKPAPPPDFYTGLPVSDSNYTLDFSNPNYMNDPSSILSYNFTFVGTDVYRRLINMKNFSMNSLTGLVSSKSSTIQDHIYETSGKIPIKSPSYFLDKRKDNIKDINYYGLFKDANAYSAYISSKYIDATLLMRMDIMVYFNPEIVSGRLVFLTFYNNGKINEVLTGYWLIVKTEHRYEKQIKLGNRSLITNISLGKHSFSTEQSNNYYYSKSSIQTI